MTFIPKGERLAVIWEEATAPSGIILVADTRGDVRTAQITARGTGVTDERLSVGARVLASKYAASEVQTPEGLRHIIHLDDVLAYVEEV